ncbi:50S ribosomal protein L35 [Caldicellulosiruptor morganii]|uniref:Large ribosomal subunit protein bL35 n=1 Tax=Caldicellulosiruptor morganii TaxID=1387555 RepID=A0ABY7BK56_9FIRM|nr:50S ribosomal protein L35 [Caldicellulosiruptor morganii]WAM32969.1 50S ribosomal protein L35 [Caldicellulosiruptor morganii]
MPKLKTHRGLAKRIKVSGSRKYLRKKAGKSHLLSGKSRKRKRNLKKTVVVDSTNVRAVKKLLPYL